MATSKGDPKLDYEAYLNQRINSSLDTGPSRGPSREPTAGEHARANARPNRAVGPAGDASVKKAIQSGTWMRAVSGSEKFLLQKLLIALHQGQCSNLAQAGIYLHKVWNPKAGGVFPKLSALVKKCAMITLSDRGGLELNYNCDDLRQASSGPSGRQIVPSQRHVVADQGHAGSVGHGHQQVAAAAHNVGYVPGRTMHHTARQVSVDGRVQLYNGGGHLRREWSPGGESGSAHDDAEDGYGGVHDEGMEEWDNRGQWGDETAGSEEGWEVERGEGGLRQVHRFAVGGREEGRRQAVRQDRRHEAQEDLPGGLSRRQVVEVIEQWSWSEEWRKEDRAAVTKLLWALADKRKWGEPASLKLGDAGPEMYGDKWTEESRARTNSLLERLPRLLGRCQLLYLRGERNWPASMTVELNEGVLQQAARAGARVGERQAGPSPPPKYVSRSEVPTRSRHPAPERARSRSPPPTRPRSQPQKPRPSQHLTIEPPRASYQAPTLITPNATTPALSPAFPLSAFPPTLSPILTHAPAAAAPQLDMFGGFAPPASITPQAVSMDQMALFMHNLQAVLPALGAFQPQLPSNSQPQQPANNIQNFQNLLTLLQPQAQLQVQPQVQPQAFGQAQSQLQPYTQPQPSDAALQQQLLHQLSELQQQQQQQHATAAARGSIPVPTSPSATSALPDEELRSLLPALPQEYAAPLHP